ncbi:MAG: FkbM family methyltransferase [Methylotenera sp.]|nr:MAG: FkbM family methyltransferase [Methylotenera sp.]
MKLLLAVIANLTDFVFNKLGIIMALKTMIQSSLEKFGISVRRVKRRPYQELLKNSTRYVETTIDLLGRPFTIADGQSFYFSYREIFVQEIYQFKTSSDTPRIIDCGSNYGTSIIYFKNIFPKAKITGVEADSHIFTLLSKNTRHLEVELLNKAVSANHNPVTFFSEGSDGGRAGHSIDGVASVTVEATTLDDLIDGSVDFLKLDIEGSETDAIEACTKLHLVNALFIEYHSFNNSEQLLGNLLLKLKNEGFRYYIHHQFCSPTPLMVETVQLGMDLQLNIFAKRI